MILLKISVALLVQISTFNCWHMPTTGDWTERKSTRGRSPVWRALEVGTDQRLKVIVHWWEFSPLKRSFSTIPTHKIFHFNLPSILVKQMSLKRNISSLYINVHMNYCPLFWTRLCTLYLACADSSIVLLRYQTQHNNVLVILFHTVPSHISRAVNIWSRAA